MDLLKRVLRKNRRQPNELQTALSSMTPDELVRGVVDLFTAGELRLHSRKRKRSLCPRFYRYHKANPHVAEWFLQAAQSLKREQHHDHYGIRALLEKIRFDVHLRIVKSESDGFRIANEFQACYVRQIVMRDPSLCGFFTINPSAADALVVDGRAWDDFAKDHEAELWPERAAKKKNSQSVRLFADERSGN
jgi:hypothetical protein